MNYYKFVICGKKKSYYHVTLTKKKHLFIYLFLVNRKESFKTNVVNQNNNNKVGNEFII